MKRRIIEPAISDFDSAIIYRGIFGITFYLSQMRIVFWMSIFLQQMNPVEGN